MSRYQSVFNDESKLDINYVPHKLPHRDKELHLLMGFFSFVLRFPEKMAQRVLITGDIGTGKTVLAQRFGEEIAREASKHNVDLHYVHVNCREYRGSLFLVLQQIISGFHPNFPRRGYSAEELLRILIRMLDEEKAYVVLVLDEFDSLIEREGSDAVYKLTRMQEARQNKPQRLSLICIMRSLGPIAHLDESTRSTLQSNVINLKKYSKEQLIDILSDRIVLAFKPLTVSEDTLDLTAELAYSENGNARFGIELLWRAGKYSDAENLGAVTPECVRKAFSSVIAAVRKSDLASLNFHEQLFLLGMTRLFEESQKASASLTDVEKAYAIICEEFNSKPHSHTQLWKYLQHLSTIGVLKTEVSGSGSRGRSTLIYFQLSTNETGNELEAVLKKEEM